MKVDDVETNGLAATEMKPSDPRRRALIASLRGRYDLAVERQDPEAKRALFKEAAYLGIRLEDFQDGPSSAG
jgi:hypothetical protein